MPFLTAEANGCRLRSLLDGAGLAAVGHEVLELLLEAAHVLLGGVQVGRLVVELNLAVGAAAAAALCPLFPRFAWCGESGEPKQLKGPQFKPLSAYSTVVKSYGSKLDAKKDLGIDLRVKSQKKLGNLESRSRTIYETSKEP